ncbi:MAG TPA: DinB family protein [Bacteroidota bacterium]|nr:DinB family protein [Bacteroidota bacterium]
MTTSEAFIAELTQESEGTKSLLLRIPEEHLMWKPHEKSMTIGRLGMHIAELTGWITTCLETPSFDFPAGSYKPFIPSARAQIMEAFDKNLRKAVSVLSVASEEVLARQWKFTVGGQPVFELPRAQVVRGGISHIIHHRGQLTVFLRLLNVPLPGLYGPTADER